MQLWALKGLEITGPNRTSTDPWWSRAAQLPGGVNKIVLTLVRRVLTGCLIGAAVSIAIHVVMRSAPAAKVSRAWEKGWFTTSADETYGPGLIAFSLSILGLLTLALFPYMPRLIRSWWAGMVSLVVPLTACVAGLLLTVADLRVASVLATAFVVLIAMALLEVWRQSGAGPSRSQISLAPLLIGRNELPVENRWHAPISDDPITDLNDDIIGRAAVIELVREHALIYRTPVIALQGGLGDGKSSVLQLLRRAVKDQAIVVSFSAWLPGSESTLAVDLFRDIATECRRQVYVPQLRKRGLMFARTLSSSTSFLAGLKELLPAQSQRDEISELHAAFARIPRRIVVLVDEIDRMQRDELLVLLKILRGASSLPNLSFVCAYSEQDLKKQLGVGDDYLEKFFPVSINLAQPPAELVGRCFRAELQRRLSSLHWFRNEAEATEFNQLLEDLWTDPLQMMCTNLRKAALLVNNTSSAASPVVGEVNALDLVIVEAIRRFSPSVYKRVRDAAGYLTDTWKDPYSKQEETQNLFADLDAEVDNSSNPAAIKTLLYRLFPKYALRADTLYRIKFGSRRGKKDDGIADDKRIFDPQYFPIYFRGAVPDEMFSNAELQQLLSMLVAANTEQDVEAIFAATLRSIPAGDAKRADFLWKLARATEQLDAALAERIAYSAAQHAADYVYDYFHSGEAAFALNMVFVAAQKLSASTPQRVLEGAMQRATEDTFAIRLLDITERREKNKILTDYSKVDAGELANAFYARMRDRYGADQLDVANLLARADWWAFRRWVGASDRDRNTEVGFWRRFISNRKRLAQAINFIYPSRVFWDQDPRPIIEQLFPLEEFRALMEGLEDNGDLDAIEEDSLKRLRELLEGEYPTPGSISPSNGT